jgi:hypothetical protein
MDCASVRQLQDRSHLSNDNFALQPTTRVCQFVTASIYEVVRRDTALAHDGSADFAIQPVTKRHFHSRFPFPYLIVKRLLVKNRVNLIHGKVEPHGLTAVVPLHARRRAEPSEAHPPSPRLRRVPTSHSSTGLHPWPSAEEGNAKPLPQPFRKITVLKGSHAQGRGKRW